MTEEFIHYLWRFQLIHLPLFTVNNEPVVICNPGIANKDAGPDYLNARVRIGDTLWAGDIEIHVKSSDWNLHGHSSDKRYDSVILHVVYENNETVMRTDFQEIPVLVIKELFDEELFDKYESFLSSLSWIPCENSLQSMSPSVWEPWLVYLAKERVERKSHFIDRLYTINKGDSEQALYQCLAIGFGQKVNTAPFEYLSQSIDIKLIMKYQEDLFSLESLCFGQAGFLSGAESDAYSEALTVRYNYLRAKHTLEPIPVHLWRFLRMRPAGFPTLRIAQWASFLHHHADALPRLIQASSAEDLLASFNIEISEYWQNHYHFNRKSNCLSSGIGKDTALTVILNSVIPFIFIKGVRGGDNTVIQRSLDLLRLLPSEDNTIIRSWEKGNIRSNNSLDSQALLELKTQYCDRKNCLYCAVGHHLLSAPD